MQITPPPRKKVLIFSLSYFPDFVGGAEVSIKEITDRLPDIDFHLITNRYNSRLPTEEKIGNVTVYRIGSSKRDPTIVDLKKFPLVLNKLTYQFTAAWKAHALHGVHKFDAIWAMMAHSAGVPAGLTKFFHPKIGYVLNLQEGDPPEYIERKLKPLWPLFKLAFTSADIVQPLSNYLAEWAKRMGAKKSIEVIPNAADTKLFSKTYPEEALNEIRSKLGKSKGDTFLVTTSRLVHKNGLEDVLWAMTLLPDTVKFAVVGTGPDEEKLKSLVEQLQLWQRVHFFGFVPHEEIPKYLKACDIYIRPSRSEGFGASFVEAMAAELPVVATQEGGIADFLFDEKRNTDKQPTGWAVDKDSPESIAKAVTDILSRPEKVRDIVANAKKMAVEKYDWDVIAKQMRQKVFAKLFKEDGVAQVVPRV